MKKLLAVIPIAILFVLLSKYIFVLADTSTLIICAEAYENAGYYMRYGYTINENSYINVLSNNHIRIEYAIPLGYSQPQSSFNTLSEAFEYDQSYFSYSGSSQISWYGEIVYIGDINIVGSSENLYSEEEYNNIINPPEPELTWWDILKENAQRVIRDILELSGIPVDAAIDLDNWFSDLFIVKVGEGEDSLANQINTEPLPTPTPTPTPIPYQTVMTPDNNGGFIIQYIYNNPSGTPTAHPQPPSNNITNNYGSDFEYPYYENPENKDNPFKLKIPWYLKLILNNNDIPIETLDDHYLVAQNQIQSDDVLEAIDTVYNGFQVIPTDWLLILGAIACLPVFASLISRMLNG